VELEGIGTCDLLYLASGEANYFTAGIFVRSMQLEVIVLVLGKFPCDESM